LKEARKIETWNKQNSFLTAALVGWFFNNVMFRSAFHASWNDKSILTSASSLCNFDESNKAHHLFSRPSEKTETQLKAIHFSELETFSVLEL
jgi:hypothetical protein